MVINHHKVTLQHVHVRSTTSEHCKREGGYSLHEIQSCILTFLLLALSGALSTTVDCALPRLKVWKLWRESPKIEEILYNMYVKKQKAGHQTKNWSDINMCASSHQQRVVTDNSQYYINTVHITMTPKTLSCKKCFC